MATNIYVTTLYKFETNNAQEALDAVRRVRLSAIMMEGRRLHEGRFIDAEELPPTIEIELTEKI